MESDGKKWYEEVDKYNTVDDDDFSVEEAGTLKTACENAFTKGFDVIQRKNPTDAKWLQTALHQGTLRDRANAGALLFQSNPLGNLSALDVLIGLTKAANKASVDVIDVITDLFITSILPGNRKLLSIDQRGSGYRAVKGEKKLEKSYMEKIYMYWHFEAQLKERYFTFLQNLEGVLKAGQDVHKCLAIVCASKLLIHSPEKEAMLLSMLMNKMGDPQVKVASKAQYHITEVANQHPNMCVVIVRDAERLIFRPNISERAQHVTLTFLAEIAALCAPKVCEKLTNICFAFFKILVDKGMVNNKTMQAILRCLRRSVGNAFENATDATTNPLNEEMQNIIYRLIHFAEIRIAIQALGLLLQVLVTCRTIKSDRFYTALYRKMVSVELTTMTHKWSAQFMYICHRAIAIDQDIPRAQAFLKRLLQLTFYLPAQMVCGVFVIMQKILEDRPELNKIQEIPSPEDIAKMEVKAQLYDSDSEHYSDADEEESVKKKSKKANGVKSWCHVNLNEVKAEKKEVKPKNHRISSKYDPFYRNPAGAGAQYEPFLELLRFSAHFHPTVQKFVSCILDRQKNKYYGDPLVDFSLTQFLDRFSFKNPKKKNPEKEIVSVVQKAHKEYKAAGSRGQPIRTISEENCSENEKFIFDFLKKRRELTWMKEENDSDSDGSVDDDEFDAYLDSLGPKSDEKLDVDYMKEINDGEQKRSKTKKSHGEEEKNGDEEDWNSDNTDDDLSLDEDESDDDAEVMSFSSSSGDEEEQSSDQGSEEESHPKMKKGKTANLMSDKNFRRKLKEKADMSSLFAAADDFSEIIEKNSRRSKKHGTLEDVANKDNSSEKQMKWEENRMRGTKKRSFKPGKPQIKGNGKKKRKY
ncbi:CCAAT/enhancer-binding protein zeta [Sergentomyia squamirostris]